ncbi:MAG: hypothetical protein M4579_001541 [Chaenotheca gracillima]|nr:MAG: hypothetical protein M4579_001541 [Chaenotheca gracillima]
MGLPVFREPSEKAPAARETPSPPNASQSRPPFTASNYRDSTTRPQSPPRHVARSRPTATAASPYGDLSTTQGTTRPRVPTARARIEASSDTRNPIMIMTGVPAESSSQPLLRQTPVESNIRESSTPRLLRSLPRVQRDGDGFFMAPREAGQAPPTTRVIGQDRRRAPQAQNNDGLERVVPGDTEENCEEEEEGRGISLTEFLDQSRRASARRLEMENPNGSDPSVPRTESPAPTPLTPPELRRERTLRSEPTVASQFGVVGDMGAALDLTSPDGPAGAPEPRQAGVSSVPRGLLSLARYMQSMDRRLPSETRSTAEDDQTDRDSRSGDLAGNSRRRTGAAQPFTELYNTLIAQEASPINALVTRIHRGSLQVPEIQRLSLFQERLDVLASEFEMVRALRRDLHLRQSLIQAELDILVARREHFAADSAVLDAAQNGRRDLLRRIQDCLERLEARLGTLRRLVCPPPEPGSAPNIARPLNPAIVALSPHIVDSNTRQILETLMALSRDDLQEQEWITLAAVILAAQQRRTSRLPSPFVALRPSSLNPPAPTGEADVRRPPGRDDLPNSSRTVAVIERSSTMMTPTELLDPHSSRSNRTGLARDLSTDLQNIRIRPNVLAPGQTQRRVAETLEEITHNYHCAWATLDHGGSVGDERLICQEDLQRQFDLLLQNTPQQGHRSSASSPQSPSSLEGSNIQQDQASNEGESSTSTDSSSEDSSDDNVDVRTVVAQRNPFREIHPISEPRSQGGVAGPYSSTRSPTSPSSFYEVAPAGTTAQPAPRDDSYEALEAASMRLAEDLAMLRREANEVRDWQFRLINEVQLAEVAHRRTRSLLLGWEQHDPRDGRTSHPPSILPAELGTRVNTMDTAESSRPPPLTPRDPVPAARQADGAGGSEIGAFWNQFSR